MNIATTSEQSARLMACGVDPDTADMFYQPALTLSGKRKGEIYLLMRGPDMEFEKNDTPAWSLSALIEILPKHLNDFPFNKLTPPFLDGEIWDKDIPSVLNGDLTLYSNGTNWIVDYDWDGFTGTLPQSENPIEAVVLAVELLYANGYDFRISKLTTNEDN